MTFLSVFTHVFPGVASHTEGAGAGAAVGERVSRKRRAEGEFVLLARTLGSARPTRQAAQPAGTNANALRNCAESTWQCQDCHLIVIVESKQATTALRYSASCLAAWVSVGSWKVPLNNHLIPLIASLTRNSGFLLMYF